MISVLLQLNGEAQKRYTHHENTKFEKQYDQSDL